MNTYLLASIADTHQAELRDTAARWRLARAVAYPRPGLLRRLLDAGQLGGNARDRRTPTPAYPAEPMTPCVRVGR